MENNSNNERRAQESNDNRPTTPTATTPKPIYQKQTSLRGSCLCSPTTHTGSFRCRLHRNSIRRNGNSYGAGLSDLGNGSVGSDLSNLGNKGSSSPHSPATATITKA